MKKIPFAILALCISISASAQSAQWSVAPVYKAIDRLSPTLFRLSATEKVGLATADGTIVIDTIADAVTSFSDGYAFAVNKEKKKMQLLAIIDESGKATEPSEELYTDALPLFANGKLLAKNKKNKYGYLTADGAFTVSDEAADEAKALGKKKNKGNKATDDIVTGIAEDGPQPFSATERKVSRVGYKNGEHVVLPPQFISAQPFKGGYAIAETESGFGILKLTPQSFTCKQTQAVMDAGMENTTHSSSLPANPEATLKMKCVDSTGMIFEGEGKKKGSNMIFELSSFRERRTFTIIATDAKGSLVLWNSNYDNQEVEAKDKGKSKTKTKTKTKTKKKKK